MSYRLPRVVGHRGAAASAPENTLAGLRRAHQLGVGWVEFDVKLSGDGVPILMHDAVLERTTDGKGAVADTAYADIRALDAGAWFGPEFAGERVPSFDEAIDLLLSHGLGANVEIKPCPGRERETGAAVARRLAKGRPTGRRCCCRACRVAIEPRARRCRSCCAVVGPCRGLATAERLGHLCASATWRRPRSPGSGRPAIRCWSIR
jgi:hypothetical protein